MSESLSFLTLEFVCLFVCYAARYSSGDKETLSLIFSSTIGSNEFSRTYLVEDTEME